MTKCHTLLLIALLLAALSCKTERQGVSLSDYGSQSRATQTAMFEQFVLKLLAADPERARQMQDSIMSVADSDSTMWRQITRLEEKFFLDPDSPYRSEELYIPVAERILSSSLSSEEQRLRAEWLLPRLRLNRPGRMAADFSFISPKGRKSSLYEAVDAAKPDFTLLLFSNPGCPDCRKIAESLSHNLNIEAMIAERKLLVVNIYPDEDIQAWLDFLPNYPDSWICGQDSEQILNDDSIYWLRAIPSLYLLDKEKRIIVKDAPLEQILSILSSISKAD